MAHTPQGPQATQPNAARRRRRAKGALLGGALLLAAGAAYALFGRQVQPAEPLNVLLITLDTTRADHLGCYGYSRQTSPNLDGVAAQGTLFRRAIAQASVTPVSHASILTGLNPYSHGLRVMHGETQNRLADEQVTLTEVLRASGFDTAAFVSAFPVTERFGLNQGFDVFDDDFMRDRLEQLVSEDGIVSTGRNQRHAGITTDRALTWLAQSGSPTFAWLHYFDPHDVNVLPPAEALASHDTPRGTERQRLLAYYDIEIAYMDAQIGRVLDWLEASGQAERTIVVVVADHGEGLGDHNWWTHGILYQEQVHVPLIIRAPNVPAGHRVDSLVRTIDIMPTVLELAGLDPKSFPPMDGQSLVPLLRDNARDPRLTAYCDSVNMLTYSVMRGFTDKKDDMLFSVIDGPWKYIHHMLRQSESELYNLNTDPRELTNLLGARPDIVRRLRDNLRARQCIPAGQIEGPGRMSPADVARLRSLGYVGE